MDAAIKQQVVELYRQGVSIRKISAAIQGRYKRESIRMVLHEAGIGMRGAGVKYKLPVEMGDGERVEFAELLGCLYGDGHLTREKNAPTRFGCTLTFATNEVDLVRKMRGITRRIFEFTPTLTYGKGCVDIVFRRTLGTYLHRFGYPAGKKSKINPHLPLHFLTSDGLKTAFIRGFLNAECGVHQTLTVQQSVRILPSKAQIDRLREVGHTVILKKSSCQLIPWSKAEGIVGKKKYKSNILFDIQLLLESLNIPSKLYPVRVYVGATGATSIHFELRILRQYIKRALELQLVDCAKKLEKLKQLSGSVGEV